MPDNLSSVSSNTMRKTVSQYFVQSIFTFLLATFSALAIVLDWGNNNLWTMLLVLSVAHMLNLPLIELTAILSESFKSKQVPGNSLSEIP